MTRYWRLATMVKATQVDDSNNPLWHDLPVYLGDWVVEDNGTLSIYKPDAFVKAFVEVQDAKDS